MHRRAIIRGPRSSLMNRLRRAPVRSVGGRPRNAFRSPLLPAREIDHTRARNKIRERRKNLAALKLAKNKPVIRKVTSIDGHGWRYKLFFRTPTINSEVIARMAEIKDFVRGSYSGKFKIKYQSNYSRTRFSGDDGRTVIDHVLFNDEQNLFITMLCHPDWVNKIFEFEVEEKAP